METFGSWINRLREQDNNIIKIINNLTHLKIYLELLSNFINSNPIILNNNGERNVLEPLTKSRVEQCEEMIDKLSYLGKQNIQYIPHIPLNEQQQNRTNILLKISNTIETAHKLSPPPFLPLAYIHLAQSGLFRGGGKKSNVIKDIIVELIKELKSKDKIINKNDLNKINTYIEELDLLENNLNKNAQQMRQLKDWLSIISNDKNDHINSDYIKNNLMKYKDCVKKYKQLEQILISIAIKLNYIIEK